MAAASVASKVSRGSYDGVETVHSLDSDNVSKVAQETLEDVFARVDSSLARAQSTQVPLHAQDAHTALIAELTSALDEARGRLRRAEVELRTYSQTRAGSPGDETVQQMSNEIAALASRAEVAEAQARRAEQVNRALQDEITSWRQSASSEQLAQVRADTEGAAAGVEARAALGEAAPDDELATLRKKLQVEQARASKLQSELAVTRVELSNTKAAPPVSESQARVVAMQQEIATLNQQMAHLFTELTFARTELAQRSEQQDPSKELAQVPELLQDMRHLQLDLEYHQQKLDQVLEENTSLREEVAKRKEEAQALVTKEEEAQQQVRHLEIELATRSRAGPPAAQATGSPGGTSELRKEIKAKEGLLTMSHYELHKEKLARQRAEQRAGKLRDRLEKLMAVVEQQRQAVRELEARALAAETNANEGTAKLRVASNQVSRLTHLLGVTGKEPSVPDRKGA